jgi:hypothetical protein
VFAGRKKKPDEPVFREVGVLTANIFVVPSSPAQKKKKIVKGKGQGGQ